MKNIILIGFMGCGKTSVGMRLAKNLALDFLDTDTLIVEKSGMPIAEIFEKNGEDAFRRMETECLQELLSKQGNGAVLSVGGGLPIREENRKLLAKLGHVIYLKASPEVVYNRVRNDKSRPLLQTTNPRGRIMDLMNARKRYYEEAADSIIEVDNKGFSQIMNEIKELYG